MSDHQQTSDKSPADPPQEKKPRIAVVSFDLRMLHYRTVLRLLLFSPKLALLLLGAKGFLFKSLIVMAAIAFIGSCAMTAGRMPDYSLDIANGTQFLSECTGGIAIRDGRLQWQHPETDLPAAARVPHGRIDVVTESASVNYGDFVLAGDRQGVVFAPEGIKCWIAGDAGNAESFVSEGRHGVMVMSCIDSAQLHKMETLLRQDNEGHTWFLDAKKQEEVTSMLFAVVFFGLWGAEFLLILKSMVLYGMVSGIVMLFVGGKQLFCSPRAIFSVGLNLTFIPAILASFYCMTGFFSDFDLAYCISLGVYVFYAFIEGRNGRLLPGKK